MYVNRLGQTFVRRATSEWFSRKKEKKESVYITLPQSANAVVTIRINIMQRNIDRNTYEKIELDKVCILFSKTQLLGRGKTNTVG